MKSILFILLLCTSFPQLADSVQGEKLYNTYQCHLCHGSKGDTPAHKGYPLIAGQDYTYLYRQLIDIRDGSRDGGRTIVMRPLMYSLTDQDLQDISEYLSLLSWAGN